MRSRHGNIPKYFGLLSPSDNQIHDATSVTYPGLGLGVKLIAAAAAGVYGIQHSMYTVDGGHRAIIFGRIGGVQQQIYSEGLHFRYVRCIGFMSLIH